MDYVAEIAGAVGAHYCFDHASFSAGISDAPPRSWAHADRPAHLGSDSRPAADFRYRDVDKLMTEVETRDIPRNWDVFVTAGMCITKPPQSFHLLHEVQQRYAFLLI
jgi:hypothetical protein